MVAILLNSFLAVLSASQGAGSSAAGEYQLVVGQPYVDAQRRRDEANCGTVGASQQKRPRLAVYVRECKTHSYVNAQKQVVSRREVCGSYSFSRCI